MRLLALALALFVTGCASMPAMQGEGLPLAKSGWRMTGVLELAATFNRSAEDADKILLPE